MALHITIKLRSHQLAARLLREAIIDEKRLAHEALNYRSTHVPSSSESDNHIVELKQAIVHCNHTIELEEQLKAINKPVTQIKEEEVPW